MSSSMSAMPRRLAATCAFRSLRLSASLRVPGDPLALGFVSRFVIPSRSYLPATTSLNASMAAPSSAIDRENGGMDPGVIPPTSAWCPLDATRNTISPCLNTGVTTVMSGRWLPPALGWLVTRTSPSFSPPFCAQWFSCHRTVSLMAPRCTGTCGAFATKPPSGPNSAHEKSRRSLMLVLTLVRCSVRPICSAMPMNRLLKMDSCTASAFSDEWVF
mmetsp:Transcript_294/g.1368  ORF Transcript_294/g.1368 Transcript_294/m.1368 type:complete len:216 (+) Transcript_294:1007-1654(+)